jgi:hypothetical protein
LLKGGKMGNHMKCEIFADGHILDLRNGINDWLKNHNNINLIYICQSESYDINMRTYSVTISIFYREESTWA